MTTYTIPIDDVAAYEYGSTRPDKLLRIRTDELELPRKIEVIFIDINTDYQQGMEQDQRQITTADGVLNIKLPLVLTTDAAAKIANILLYNAWVERIAYELTLPFKYINLDPTDRLIIVLDGTTHLMRITEISIQAPLLIKIKGVAEDNAIYTSNSVGSITQQTSATVAFTGPTIAKYMDIPLLRDQDDYNGFYIAASGYNTKWGGCLVYKSTDSGSTYTSLVAITSTSKIGFATGILATTPYPWQWDNGHTVNVDLITGTLSGTTELNVLAGANHALLGGEIIGFVNVTLEVDGTYTLSKLLRGRQGTDAEVGTHLSGEDFILLEDTATIRKTENIADIGLSRNYKAVTIGKTLQGTNSNVFTNNSVGLKPYSPVHVKSTRAANGDWTITWKHRTRAGGEWRDGVDITLSETSEKYLVDVYTTTTASTVLTTLATVTAESVTYTSAQVVSDFGFARSNLSVGIFQLSSTVGRGIQRRVTVT